MAEGLRRKEDSLTALEFTRGGIDVPVAGGLVDLQPGRRHWPFTLEKWYADVLLPDGTVILVYLVQFRALGFSRALVTAELFRPGYPAIRGDAPAPRVEGGEGWLDLGAARIDGEVLSFETPGLAGRLKYSARYPPAALGAPFVAQRQRTLEWTVEVPDADVEGEVAWPGGRLPIRGRGYRDRVWLDVLPWRMPLRELAWGRIAAGPHATTWTVARLAGGGVRSVAWADGRIIQAEERPGTLGESRVLVESAVADLPGLNLGALRPVLRRLALDPREVKWACPATIGGHAGVAIHERVRWS